MTDETGAAARLQAMAAAVTGWTPAQPTTDPPPVPSLVAPRRALGWLLAVGAVVVAVSALLLYRHHDGGSVMAPTPPAAASSVVAPSPPAQLVVDVGGRVRHPGLVTLAAGARVADAIAAAGGALDPHDLARVNMAARVSDGQLLLVGVPGASVAGSGGAAGAPVDLNAATVDQLDALPGVGPVLAQRIVSWREAHGGFGSVEQLQQVPGIGARKFADLEALVVV